MEELRRLSFIWLLSFWACSAEGNAPEPDWVVSTFQRRFWHGYCSMTQPAVSDGVLYLGGGYAWDNKTYVSAIDLNSRRIIWRFKSGEIFTGSNVPVGRHAIYFAAGETLYALRRDDGSLLWSYNDVGYYRVEQEEIIYTTRRGPALAALDSMTGAELWRWPTRKWLDSPPVVLGALCVFLGRRSSPIRSPNYRPGRYSPSTVCQNSPFNIRQTTALLHRSTVAFR